jgi:hypothetical protein
MIEIICLLLLISIGFMLYKMNYANNINKNNLEENIKKLSDNLKSKSPKKYYIVSNIGLSYEPSNTELGVETAISMLKSYPSYRLIEG